MLTGKTIGELTNLVNPTFDTLFPVELSGVTYHIDFAAISNNIILNDITYSELYNSYTGGTLVAGSYYKITDFQTCYDQPDYDNQGNAITTGNYRTSEVDPIIVFATSNTSLSDFAYQPSFPKDKLKYDITFVTTEVTDSPAKGRITERIDEYNNRTDYDHRNIKFKRYTTHFLNEPISGRITGMTDLNVYGHNTYFLSELNIGDVVFLEANNPKFYKVVSIISETEMVVHGYSYNNFTDNFGFRMWYTQVKVSQGSPGSLYYFNDVGDNDIDDGGDDMYDGGNRLFTNLNGQIPYTHTQMIDPPINEYSETYFSAFTFDGTVQSGDTYFGIGSQYFTNQYPGLFVMVAKDVDVSEFYIDGNLGSDGGGQADLLDYTLSLSGNDFSVYCKRVWDAGDPSVNHIMIVNTIDENISRDADLSTEDDFDFIGNLSGVTQIHYLLFGLAQGVKPTNTQIQDIVNSYLSVVDLSDINNTLSNLNINYSSITDNVPTSDQHFVSLEWKQNNFSGDTDYYEQHTFANINYFINNYFGDHANLSVWDEKVFLLSNNVFGNSDDNTVDILGNNFGNNFYNNSFGDDVVSNLFVGQNFHSNTFYDRFRYNIVKRNFYNNVWYNNEMNSNNIGESFYSNWNTGGGFNSNDIGNYFNNNSIRDSFTNNKIGDNFEYNKIHGSFDQNELSDFTYNELYGNFIRNDAGSSFQSNNVWSQMLNNNFKYSTSQNYFGLYGNLNSFEISENSFGNEIYSNTFSGTTRYNNIQNNFSYNNIETNFSYNEIGNNFTTNNIKEGFGFGGSQSQKNYIGDYFQNNIIGEYFYNNRISSYFSNNVVGDYFQRNNVDTIVNVVDFTEFLGNISGLTYTASGSSASDGTYTDIVGTGGTGSNSSFDIVVSGNTVTSVIINQSGKLYSVNDSILILGSQIGGTDSIDDVTITVTSVTAPSVYESYTCNIFQREGGLNRLSFYDENDILTIKNINE